MGLREIVTARDATTRGAYDLIGLALFYLIYSLLWLMGLGVDFLTIFVTVSVSALVICSATFFLMVLDLFLGLGLTATGSAFDRLFFSWGYLSLREFMKWMVIFVAGIFSESYLNFPAMELVSSPLAYTVLYAAVSYSRLPELMMRLLKSGLDANARGF